MRHFRNRQRGNPIKLIPKIILVVIVLGIAFFVYHWQQYNYFISTPVNSQAAADIILTVKKGDTTKDISVNLAQKNLLLNEDSFKWYSKFNNLDKQFKTGRFTLNQTLTVQEIAKILSSDDQRQVVLTIPEGSTVEEIDKIVNDAGLAPAGEFSLAVKNFQNYQKYTFLDKESQSKLIYPLEGYLFPDTYFISPTTYSSDLLISQLLNTFKSKALPETTSSTRSLSQLINVAAMIEKETNADIDRPIVSGIIWKRLDEKWILGIDATLLYLKKDRQLDYQDLQSDDEYNTRTRQGLPAGPIGNPGLDSIKAAATPATTPYYYYLTSKDGKTVYATTNAEHNSNKAKYL